MKKKGLLLILAILASACASTSSGLGPACLYDRQGRYDTGRVIANREHDDAKLFQFNDTSKGDHGFQWVKPSDSRSIRPCREATLMDAESPAPAAIADPIEIPK